MSTGQRRRPSSRLASRLFSRVFSRLASLSKYGRERARAEAWGRPGPRVLNPRLNRINRPCNRKFHHESTTSAEKLGIAQSSPIKLPLHKDVLQPHPLG